MSFICIDFCVYHCTNTSLLPSSFPFLPPSPYLSLPVCVLIPEINIKYLPQLFSYFLRQDISLNPEFINFDRIATQQTLVTLPLPLPSTGIVDTVFSLHFLYGCWGSELRPYCSCSQHFVN